MTALSVQIPGWYLIAHRYKGTKEVVGKGSNPIILRWAANVGGWLKSFFKDDDIPWCGLFVNTCLMEAGYSSLGQQSLSALAWASYGVDAPLVPGAILVFKRPGGGHVGFYAGESADGKSLYVLGGNQSNSVSETWLDRARLVAVRWPKDAPPPEPRPATIVARNGSPLSTNEA